jgi:hypothetical protein
MSRYISVAAALAVAACSTTEESTTVSGGVGQGQVVGGVASGVGEVGSGVVSGVTTVGSAVISPFRPSSYSGERGYTDVNGVYHRYTRYGYYDAAGTYIPYDNVRGAWCAKWDPVNNTCIWWLTG